VVKFKGEDMPTARVAAHVARLPKNLIPH
jgi:hypothetical protein